VLNEGGRVTLDELSEILGRRKKEIAFVLYALMYGAGKRRVTSVRCKRDFDKHYVLCYEEVNDG